MNPQNLKNFKPGQSGNPAGKPKGTKNASTIIKKWLETKMPVTDPVTKKKQKGTVIDNMTIALITKALKGDVAAFNTLTDKAYGKATQPVDLSTLGKEIPRTPVIVIMEDKGEHNG